MDAHRSESRRTAQAGLEWAAELGQEILDRLDEIRVIELIPDNFFSPRTEPYRRVFFDELTRRNVPVIVHAVNLSIASIEPLKQDYFDQVMGVGEGLPVYSVTDHLCMTEMCGVAVGQLTPSPYTDETLEAVADKVAEIERQLDVPFALENITHTFQIPGQQYTETEFIRALQRRTGVSLLLDLNNIYSNGMNFGVDPYRYVDEVDLQRVDSLHLAGGFFDDDDFLQDGHNERVPEPVWDLFEYVIVRAGRPITTIVERTGNNAGGLQPVLDDVERAQATMDRLLEAAA